MQLPRSFPFAGMVRPGNLRLILGNTDLVLRSLTGVFETLFDNAKSLVMVLAFKPWLGIISLVFQSFFARPSDACRKRQDHPDNF